jgi:hypothetical protein
MHCPYFIAVFNASLQGAAILFNLCGLRLCMGKVIIGSYRIKEFVYILYTGNRFEMRILNFFRTIFVIYVYKFCL